MSEMQITLGEAEVYEALAEYLAKHYFNGHISSEVSKIMKTRNKPSYDITVTLNEKEEFEEVREFKDAVIEK